MVFYLLCHRYISESKVICPLKYKTILHISISVNMVPSTQLSKQRPGSHPRLLPYPPTPELLGHFRGLQIAR